uniref:Uncharacterized protein n=1 Tax=Pithovirus LCPAC404 TaxID=2506597 RepID=A0A481ZE13_9VIRU|nr:MAG: hypothetical protein LCPAC404_00840 [Pithovirus LCPAC404]
MYYAAKGGMLFGLIYAELKIGEICGVITGFDGYNVISEKIGMFRITVVENGYYEEDVYGDENGTVVCLPEPRFNEPFTISPGSNGKMNINIGKDSKCEIQWKICLGEAEKGGHKNIIKYITDKGMA